MASEKEFQEGGETYFVRMDTLNMNIDTLLEAAIFLEKRTESPGSTPAAKARGKGAFIIYGRGGGERLENRIRQKNLAPPSGIG